METWKILKLIYVFLRPFCELTVRDTEKTIKEIPLIIKFTNVITLRFQFYLHLSYKLASKKVETTRNGADTFPFFKGLKSEKYKKP